MKDSTRSVCLGLAGTDREARLGAGEVPTQLPRVNCGGERSDPAPQDAFSSLLHGVLGVLGLWLVAPRCGVGVYSVAVCGYTL